MAFFTPREIARDFVYMSFARTMSLAISFIRSLIIPGLLGPLYYGVWKTLGLIQSYAQFGDIGARAALKREIPFYAGKGDTERLALARDVAFLVNNVSILAAIICTAVAAFVLKDSMMPAPLLAFLPLLYMTHITSFMEQLLYAQKEFTWMSRLNMWAGVLEGVLAIGLTWIMGRHGLAIQGLILGTFLAYGVATIAQLKRCRFELRLRWDWAVFKELVKVGFPSHLNGLLYNIFHSIDRWLILSFLGLTNFGYYAFGMTITDYLFQFSYSLGNIISPRLVERYSEREKIEDLRRMVEVPLIVISRVAPAALGVVAFVSEAVVHTMLRSFEAGLLPLQILLVGTFFSSVPRGLSSFFITVRRQAQTVHLYLISIAVNALTVWWFLSRGYGLPGAALGTTISLVVFGYGLVVLALRYFMGAAPVARFLVRLSWPLALGLALAWAGHMCSAALERPGESDGILFARLMAGAAIFLAGYAPVLVSLYRRYGPSLRPAGPAAPGSS
ncbi:MAG TPA: oligosaccharide flippase family protein [Candidatus Polarisedimenticolia bacterium]|jgi:O-antigen/teichoic acid export membrane protein